MPTIETLAARTCVLALALATGCVLAPRAPAESPTAGTLIAAYQIDAYAGGSLDVRLTADRYSVVEWITNNYSIPVAIDFEREAVNLRPHGDVTRSMLVPSHGVQRAAVWDIADSDIPWKEHSQLRTQLGSPSARASAYVYALPFAVGEPHEVIQGFHGAFSHNGDEEFAVDFAMPEGTPVRAARDGIVVAYNDKATTHGASPEFRDRAHANWVAVLHDDGTLGEYWHLMPGGVSVKIGQRVARGDVLGRSGFTGFTSRPHLHFAVKTAVDGAHARSFAFAFKTRADDRSGETPQAGKTYAAFE